MSSSSPSADTNAAAPSRAAPILFSSFMLPEMSRTRTTCACFFAADHRSSTALTTVGSGTSSVVCGSRGIDAVRRSIGAASAMPGSAGRKP